MPKWHVIETPCFPNAWKVVHSQYGHSNATCNYFPSWQAAQNEADARNAREEIYARTFNVELPGELTKALAELEMPTTKYKVSLTGWQLFKLIRRLKNVGNEAAEKTAVELAKQMSCEVAA